MSKNQERALSSRNEDIQDASKREKPALMPKPKPKPELKPKPKSEARTQWPEDTTNTTTNTVNTATTTRQGKDCAQKEEQFADVVAQLKIQLDKKARAEAGVGTGVGA